MSEYDTNDSPFVAWLLLLVLTLAAIGLVALCIGLMGALS